ncbi:MAG: PDZ domain-containing protein, partial [Candidatus Omnitrophica bacterium]|nr:PDZ domain-containing protein [Candidatus Omnitrophota bacterium]
RDLIKMVSASEVGASIPLKIVRAGKPMNIQVKIGSTPAGPESMYAVKDQEKPQDTVTFRGMTVDDISSLHKSTYRLKSDNGVVIIDIEANSVADLSGLVPGDVILKVENQTIENKKQFDSVVSKIKGSCLVKTNRGYFVVRE